MIDPLEYMYGGDTAVAAVQYSFLPSWMSFIADKEPARQAGRDLFDAVYTRWLRLPAGPPGHGHTYGMYQGATAWASIIAPPGWTAAKSAALGELAAG